MRRRDFLAAVGGGAITWPQLASAQQRRVRTIGYLYAGTVAEGRDNGDAFIQGLAETGYVVGQNVEFEVREAKDDLRRLPELARDLVNRQVDVILAPGSGAAALAAKGATTEIPIVFSIAGDPVQMGLVASLSHPGGNITGVADFGIALSAKRLELIKLLIPATATVAILAVKNQPRTAPELADAEVGARSLGIDMSIAWVSTVEEIDAAFATLVGKRVDAVCMVTNLLFFGHRQRVVDLAARCRMPMMYPFIAYTQAGGLMSYGSSVLERARQAGRYVALILNGQKPADLPVHRLTRFELGINMTTAKALKLTVPARFLALTDRVIA